MTLHARITAVLARARVAGGWLDEDVATAVLREIREPTEAMVDAPYDAELDIYWGYTSTGPGEADDVWRAMIDAAITEAGASPVAIDLPTRAQPRVLEEPHTISPDVASRFAAWDAEFAFGRDEATTIQPVRAEVSQDDAPDGIDERIQPALGDDHWSAMLDAAIAESQTDA